MGLKQVDDSMREYGYHIFLLPSNKVGEVNDP